MVRKGTTFERGLSPEEQQSKAWRRERARARQAHPESHTNFQQIVSAAFFWAIVVVFVGWPLAQLILGL